MALNRYSVLPKQNIINTQVLPDLGIIDSALGRQQQAYDTTAATAAKFQSDVSGLQGYGDYAKAKIAKVDEDTKNFIGSIANQDLGSPEVRNKFNGYVQAVSSNPELKEIQQANKLRADYETSSADLAAKNKLHDSQQYFKDKAWEVYSKTGKLPAYASQPLSEYVDPYTETMKYFKDLKANGGDAIQHLADGTAFKNSSTGIDGTRINEQAKSIFNTYKNDTIGKQKQLDYAKMVDQKIIDPKKTSLDQYLAKELTSIGNTKVYSRSSTNRDSAENRSLDKKEAKAKEDAYAGEGFMPAMSGSKKVDIDSTGRININGALDVWDWFTNGDSRTPEELKLESTLQEGAKKSGLGIKEYTEQLNKDPNVRVMYYNADKANKVSTQFYNPKTGGGTYVNSTIYTNQFPQGISTMDFLKEKGLDEKALSKGFTVTGDITSDNPYTPKGKQAIIGGESVIIDDKYSKPSLQELVQHEANKAKYNGSGVHTTRLKNPADNKTYELTYVYDASTGTVKEDESLRKVIK